ncbi:hypothetical protein CWO85_01425 [Candidatus Phytoplasma ziziphi]|uniref:Sequence-variable mosaic (SVM) signal sequence domain-containing protein n=1 Tax=Ziziphus jujuba witches'-broom phytoplasma TaxID=135727 RepID=A0A660HMC9_ZIZJU|nr:SVM family protein [Candidatus Phytoplasma ziziphi]AYJ01188.1 hypothetical protein CWO85_01425 [Candidatus Phytoplasma ziziphi]
MVKFKKQLYLFKIILFIILGLLFIANNYSVMAMENLNKEEIKSINNNKNEEKNNYEMSMNKDIETKKHFIQLIIEKIIIKIICIEIKINF